MSTQAGISNVHIIMEVEVEGGGSVSGHNIIQGIDLALADELTENSFEGDRHHLRFRCITDPISQEEALTLMSSLIIEGCECEYKHGLIGTLRELLNKWIAEGNVTPLQRDDVMFEAAQKTVAEFWLVMGTQEAQEIKSVLQVALSSVMKKLVTKIFENEEFVELVKAKGVYTASG